jgi:hypothetical protein
MLPCTAVVALGRGADSVALVTLAGSAFDRARGSNSACSLSRIATIRTRFSMAPLSRTPIENYEKTTTSSTTTSGSSVFASGVAPWTLSAGRAEITGSFTERCDVACRRS